MRAFEAGSELFRLHPHVAFGRICQCGYEVWYRIENDEGYPAARVLIVQISLQDQVVAKADFTDDGFTAYCQHVRVEPTHQRRGLATATYVFAEIVFGKPLSNHWASEPHQSEAAKAMWANPNRPFGRPGR